MAKEIITKKSILKEFNVFSRVLIASGFLGSSILASAAILASYITSGNICFENTIGCIIELSFVFIIFGCLIGLRQLLKALNLVKHLNSDDFVIEVDKVIDKQALSQRYKVVLEYNEAYADSLKEWNRIKKGTKYYVFNLKKETVIKSVSKYELDEKLQTKVVSYHVHPMNKFEKWEEE